MANLLKPKKIANILELLITMYGTDYESILQKSISINSRAGVHYAFKLMKKENNKYIYDADMVFDAVQCNNIYMVKYLINKTNELDNVDYDEFLEYAVEYHNLHIVKYFLGKGANINCNFGFPLELAIDEENFKMAKYLLEHGATINNDTHLLDFIAAELKWPEILIKHIKKINMDYISYGIQNNNLILIKKLVRHGVTISFDDVIEALELENIKIVKYLVKQID